MAAFYGFYGRAYRAMPYSIAFLTCYIKGTIADSITQSVEVKMHTTQHMNPKFDKFDILRNIRFSLYSGIYCGSIQHFIYNIFYRKQKYQIIF